MFTMTLATVDEITTILMSLDDRTHLFNIKLIIEERIMLVPFVDNTSPTRPSPDRKCGGEEVIIRHIWRDLLWIETRNHGYPLVILIPVEDLFTKREERNRRNIIIFEHDTLIYNRKRPLLRNKLGRVATIIFLLIHTMNFTLPVDLCDNIPASLNPSHILLSSRTILIEEQLGRTGFLHLFKDLRKRFGTVEEKHQHRHINGIWIQLFH